MRYTYVMLLSLFQNQPNVNIHVYLLHSDLTPEDQSRLSSLASEYGHIIHFLLIDRDRFPVELPTSAAWSLETYFRLMLLDILPEDVDRLLYLDVDMTVSFPRHDSRDEILKNILQKGLYTLTSE